MGKRLQMLVRGRSDPEENGKSYEVLFFFFRWAGVVQATVERKDEKAQEKQQHTRCLPHARFFPFSFYLILRKSSFSGRKIGPKYFSGLPPGYTLGYLRNLLKQLTWVLLEFFLI